MSITPINLCYFVAQTRIEAMNRDFQPLDAEAATQSLPLIALAFGTIAFAVATLYFFKHHAARTSNDNLHLFAELCRSNNLSRRQCKLLRELANHQKVANPCQMFLDIELWALAPESQMPLSTPTVQAELHRLRSLLYTQGKGPPVPTIDSYL